MAIFAISDLHLSLSGEKPMDVFGAHWTDYLSRMQTAWNKIVTPEDLVIIPGDISWAMYLAETEADFSYLNALNGTKLLVRGNHDYWWTTLSKMEQYIEEKGFSTIRFLRNDAFVWENTVIAGTRGWTIAEEAGSAENQKIYQRERQRLILSLEAAAQQKKDKIITALHFPPFENDAVCEGFADILKEYGVKECVYGHLHAQSQHNAPKGEIDGVRYRLVSCDYLNFTPQLIEK